MPTSDEVDRIVDDWSRERPDVDFAPLQVLSRVARLAKHLDRARRQAFAASGLEPWEFDVLAALRRAGTPYQLSPKALLQQTLVSSGTMTNRIDRLVERRLVERRTDPHDGRGVLVVMTGRGAEAVDAAISELLTGEAELLEGLSKADQERLAGAAQEAEPRLRRGGVGVSGVASPRATASRPRMMDTGGRAGSRSTSRPVGREERDRDRRPEHDRQRQQVDAARRR